MGADARRWPTAVGVVALALCLLPASAHSQSSVSPREAVEKARTLEESGFPDRAQVYLEGLIERDESLGGRAEVLLELARLTPRWTLASALLERIPDLTRDAEILSRTHVLLGDAHFAGRKYLSASREYEDAAGLASGETALAISLKRATSLAAAGDLTAALELYERVSRRADPGSEIRQWAQLGIARTHLEQGKTEEAAERFRSVATEHPGSSAAPHAAAGAAVAFSKQGAAIESTAFLTLLEEAFPESFEPLLAARAAREAAPPDTSSAPPDSVRDAEGPAPSQQSAGDR